MLKKFLSHFKTSGPDEVTLALYRQIVEQSRRPEFYIACSVPDTLDGRFDMVMVHAWMVIRRLRTALPDGPPRAQALFDHMFADMDSNLREIGVGDLSVGKRVKAMARAFYGRVDAYDAALAAGTSAALIEALGRNLYGTQPQTPPDRIARMAAYLLESTKLLSDKDNIEILGGRLAFAPPPGAGESVSG